MSDEDVLLAAIAAHPDEDTPRLAYADWLDEHAGDLPGPDVARGRAELIRTQVERLRCEYWLPGGTSRYADLCRRAQELETWCRTSILGPAAGAGAVVWFSRGFPSLRMTAATFLGHAQRFEHLRAAALKITNAADAWYDLFAHPLLPLVTYLVVPPDPRTLESGWRLTANVVARFGELGGRNRLLGLDLAHGRVGDTGAAALAAHAAVWRLEDLDLSHNDITSGGLGELLDSSIPATLRRVNLCGNPIDDHGARALAARWPKEPGLKWLRLEGTWIGAPGRERLRERFGGKVEFGPDT